MNSISVYRHRWHQRSAHTCVANTAAGGHSQTRNSLPDHVTEPGMLPCLWRVVSALGHVYNRQLPRPHTQHHSCVSSHVTLAMTCACMHKHHLSLLS
jgi:hypothetical protein